VQDARAMLQSQMEQLAQREKAVQAEAAQLQDPAGRAGGPPPAPGRAGGPPAQGQVRFFVTGVAGDQDDAGARGAPGPRGQANGRGARGAPGAPAAPDRAGGPPAPEQFRMFFTGSAAEPGGLAMPDGGIVTIRRGPNGEIVQASGAAMGLPEPMAIGAAPIAGAGQGVLVTGDGTTSALQAIASAREILKSDPQRAIAFFRNLLGQTKNETVQRAIAMQLIDLYKQTGDTGDALNEISHVIIDTPPQTPSGPGPFFLFRSADESGVNVPGPTRIAPPSGAPPAPPPAP